MLSWSILYFEGKKVQHDTTFSYESYVPVPLYLWDDEQEMIPIWCTSNLSDYQCLLVLSTVFFGHIITHTYTHMYIHMYINVYTYVYIYIYIRIVIFFIPRFVTQVGLRTSRVKGRRPGPRARRGRGGKGLISVEWPWWWRNMKVTHIIHNICIYCIYNYMVYIYSRCHNYRTEILDYKGTVNNRTFVLCRSWSALRIRILFYNYFFRSIIIFSVL